MEMLESLAHELGTIMFPILSNRRAKLNFFWVFRATIESTHGETLETRSSAKKLPILFHLAG